MIGTIQYRQGVSLLRRLYVYVCSYGYHSCAVALLIGITVILVLLLYMVTPRLRNTLSVFAIMESLQPPYLHPLW
jgi:hypothetical protein